MLRIVNCLASQHDWRLVLLAGAVCFLTSLAAIQLFIRARETTGHTRLLWLITTGAATGFGIWATHFIAMLAFSPRLPAGYDLPLTLLSLFAAATITGGGFVLAVTTRKSWAISVSGTIIGFGIAAMHYIGMSAFRVSGHLNWAWDLVLLSIFLGIAFSVTSTNVALQFETTRMRVLSALLLAFAILAHHFTAMGAVELVPDPTVIIEATALSLSPNSLSLTIASAASAVLGISLLAAVEDRSRQLLIKRSDAEISQHAQRLETALANMSQGLCMFDQNQRVVVANRRYAEMYRLDPEQIKPGTTLRAILMARVQRGIYGEVKADEFIEARTRNLYGETREIIHLADGRFICVLGQRLSGGGLVTTHEDITERHVAEAQIRHLAHHDALTGLPNRAVLRQRLDHALQAMRRGGDACAVLMLDLDRFKEVNDTLGHSVGDGLLKAVAERLRGCVRDGDTIARLGGDEIAIVQRASEPAINSIQLAKRILDAIAAPFDLDGHQVSVGISIGIAISPDDGDDPDQLLKNADLALCRAKAEGRSTFRCFEEEMDRHMQERRNLERDMRSALHNHEFVLYYQPLVNLGNDEICGFEALLRWPHPKHENISPERFIPVAEETGLIVALGEWVLRRACTEAATWPQHLKIAVNVSPAQFQARNFADTVASILHATGLAPRRLELEITETVMMKDEEAAFRALTKLHELGVRIALDDFGTGYSSLSNLRKFPFDKIKIDRSFVGDLSVSNANALALVRSVAQLGMSLGLTTTAEGVETKEQLETVRAEGCAEIQGYYISPPAPAKDIARLIWAERNKSASAA
jgi:diguanylate cyclase (GGDEF)-like protein